MSLRLRLTAWYTAAFLSILGALGAGLFVAIRRQMSRELDASVRTATAALIQAAHIREMEQARGRGLFADALDELHIPDRSLYLFDAGGRPIKPAQADDWIAEAAREAARTGRADRDLETPDDHIVRLHAERFLGEGGTAYVATVVANRLELEDQYAALIRAFAAAAFVALLLVAVAGYFLVRQATAPVERSIAQMRRFMADAAHELRTPVTLLRTRAELAAGQDRDPTRDARTFRTIEGEAARVGEIVGELLGERPVARDQVYLDDAVAGAVEAARALAEQKGVAVEVGKFEETPIAGDTALVRQLLLIVLDNAIKFTPAAGRVRLDVSAEDGRGEVLVSDTGIGIRPDELPHVFERFYRGADAAHHAEGAGLGLAIARWIADEHGASISIVSQPGAGTRVAVRFPLTP